LHAVTTAFMCCLFSLFYSLFFFHDPATTAISTLSLHDALPISGIFSPLAGMVLVISGRDDSAGSAAANPRGSRVAMLATTPASRDRKSTRLNSSHSQISYAVFCLKKKKKKKKMKHTHYNSNN